MNISTTCHKCGTEYSQDSKAYFNLVRKYEVMANIKSLSMNPCKKCEEQLHYPSQLHTVFNGHKCCKCLGHEYGDCFNPWQRKKVSYEQFKG
mgnify:CR=1 FL=1|tara:strand:- start:328 stop:603 length:276 start_codon:yes stop_codon:yes gene_type:complete